MKLHLYDHRSYERNFNNCVEKLRKFRTSTEIELMTLRYNLVQRSNQLSYEATNVESWSFVGSKFPVRNKSMNEMIYEINYLLN